MSVKSIDENLCDGCGICIEECPADVLYLKQPAKPWLTRRWQVEVRYPADCHGCSFCEYNCPQGAIKVSCSLGSMPPDCFPDAL